MIDAHCHVGIWQPRPEVVYEVNPISRQLDSIIKIRRFLSKNTLQAAIFVPHYAHNLSEDEARLNHRFLIEVLDQIPGAFGGLLVSPEADWASKSIEIEELAAHPKIVALKVAPNVWSNASLDPESWSSTHRDRMERILQLLVDRQLVLQTHTGSGTAHPATLRGFVPRFGRDIDLHCVHMGGSASGHFFMVPTFCEWLEQGQRVFCGFSLARPFASRWVLNELRRRGLPLQNLLFASDEPWGSIAMEVARVKELDLSATEADAFVRENAKRLYKLLG